MKIEQFIKENPFPKDGAEINNFLINEIKDPSKSHLKRKNIEKLFKNNARLIYLVYNQYSYGQELSSIASFVYEGIAHAVEIYNPKIGMPFYNYAMTIIRSQLQNWYKYNESLIHIPVMKRKDHTFEYSDINDYVEHEYKYIDNNDTQDIEDRYNKINEMLIEYKACKNLTSKDHDDLEIFNMSRTYTIKEISSMKGITTSKVKRSINNISEKLKEFK